MAMPTIKVELGFDSTGPGNFFTLDDAVAGRLDNLNYVLGGGSFFYDVTSYLLSVQTNRGKSRALDRYQAGHVTITFNNRNRYFDPTYTASPFFGQIVPRRDLRISMNGVYVFYGTVDDWNLDYQPNGDNTATVSAYDGFAFLAGQTLTSQTYTSQKSGARVAAVLADPSVNWGFGSNLDTGAETLQGDAVTANDNALQYLQTIETTEPGDVFVAKDGTLTFYDRNHVFPSTSVPVLSDDNTGIKYSQVRVTYGSELLYTQAELTRKGSSTIVQANDLTAQQTYGIRTLSEQGLLNATDAALGQLATYLVGQYSQPEYRFDQVEVILSQLSSTDQATVLGLDLGSVCKVTFTPNGIGSPIVSYAKVIGINHTASLVESRVVLSLGTLDVLQFVLDDAAFGILDVGILAY